MKKIKITVIRKVNHTDLSALYKNPIEYASTLDHVTSFCEIFKTPTNYPLNSMKLNQKVKGCNA